ncbi:MAG TPA: phosphate propanoyltransferase [Anaerovoracaceae bacterium]|nr:phosphate propanoyltransferase [Anaerovoracaceae bacterium]
MDNRELQQIAGLIAEQIIKQLTDNHNAINVGISNRHIHLSEADKTILFGENYKLTILKDLRQPGQFACKETVTIKGPKGEIENVRVLGPERKQTQVEISQSDSIKLGISAPLRESGNLAASSPITVIGPKGSLKLVEGAITALRHIHMSASEAEKFGVCNGQIVSVKVNTPKGGTLDNVLVRSGDAHRLEMHIDTDEANAMGIQANENVELIILK